MALIISNLNSISTDYLEIYFRIFLAIRIQITQLIIMLSGLAKIQILKKKHLLLNANRNANQPLFSIVNRPLSSFLKNNDYQHFNRSLIDKKY